METNKYFEKIKDITESSIYFLLDKFKTNPTIYLEEKHIHNEFDRIFRENYPKDLPTLMLTKDNINFPIFMNEYSTFHKYKADEFFLKTYDEINGVNTGSLDFVVLDPNWISNNDYISCVNKDESSRKTIREQFIKLNNSPFLVTIEFKFMHFTDNQGFNNGTENSKLESILADIIGDSWKQIHENARLSYVVYFNTVFPIKSVNIQKLLSSKINRMTNEEERFWFKPTQNNEPIRKSDSDPSISQRNLKIFYTQAGVQGKKYKINFEKESDFYSLAYDYSEKEPKGIIFKE